MQFLAARSLWTNLLAFRYAIPSAISPAIWIIFLSGGKTWLVAFYGRARGDEKIERMKNTIRSIVTSHLSALISWAKQSEERTLFKSGRRNCENEEIACERAHRCELLTSLRRDRRWLLRSPRVISSIITKVGWPWETTPSSRTCSDHSNAEGSELCLRYLPHITSK